MASEPDEPDEDAESQHRRLADPVSGTRTDSGPRDDPAKPICVISPSAARRVFGVAMLAALGAMLIWVGFASVQSSVATAAIFGALAIASFWCASIVISATSSSILLLRSGLVTSDDIVVAKLDNIKAVERGLFALKPSSGFVILLRKPMPPRWKPGLWWRLGSRVGVGGATSAAENKVMAEAVQALLANRAANGGSD